jgi:hypothetical protein
MNDRLRTPFPGQPRPQVLGKPKWTAVDDECPNCGARLCMVRVAVKPPPQLRAPAGKAVAVYAGCPACPFASPSITSAGEP